MSVMFLNHMDILKKSYIYPRTHTNRHIEKETKLPIVGINIINFITLNSKSEKFVTRIIYFQQTESNRHFQLHFKVSENLQQFGTKVT